MSLINQYHSLKSNIVFITGGANGIGAAMVRAFAQQGCKVAFVDIDEKAADELVSELAGELWFSQVDASDANQLQQAIADASSALGGLDILINNVANDQRHTPENLTAEDWRRCMSINLDPTFFASQAAYKIMKENGEGSIINFSSICAFMGLEQMSGYATAKAAIVGMTKALAHDFGSSNIRVNAIMPGWVATQRQLDNLLNKEDENRWMESMALKKRILPADVANLALFLASKDSAMITGQAIAIDGGKT